jgi:hypothetical protein
MRLRQHPGGQPCQASGRLAASIRSGRESITRGDEDGAAARDLRDERSDVRIAWAVQSDARHARGLDGPELSPSGGMEAAGDDEPCAALGEGQLRARVPERLGHGACQSRRAREHELGAAERGPSEGIEVGIDFGIGHDDLVARAAQQQSQLVMTAAHAVERHGGNGSGSAAPHDGGDIRRGARIRGILSNGRQVSGLSIHQENAMRHRALLVGKGRADERRPASCRGEQGVQLGADRPPEGGIDLLEHDAGGEAILETPRGQVNALRGGGRIEAAALGVHRRDIPFGT